VVGTLVAGYLIFPKSGQILDTDEVDEAARVEVDEH
jgi:uncharacterized protein YuzE